MRNCAADGFADRLLYAAHNSRRRAGVGTLGGAAAGGIIGSAVGHAGAGAVIGGLLGLGAGALIGDQLQGQEVKHDEQEQQIEQNQNEIERQQNEIENLKGDQDYGSSRAPIGG